MEGFMLRKVTNTNIIHPQQIPCTQNASLWKPCELTYLPLREFVSNPLVHVLHLGDVLGMMWMFHVLHEGKTVRLHLIVGYYFLRKNLTSMNMSIAIHANKAASAIPSGATQSGAR